MSLFRLFTILLMAGQLLATGVQAQTTPGGGTGTTTTGGTSTGTSSPATGGAGTGTGTATGGETGTTGGTQTCDFEALKSSLRKTESSGGACGYSGTTNSTQGATAGRYQFVPATYASMSRGCPNAAQCPHAQVRAGNRACCQTEECAMNNLLASNMNGIKKNKNCQKILGKTIQSKKAGSCTVTMSGLLAAWHLGGSDACDGPANGGFGDTDGHTTESDYICKHAGKPVPEDCTPAQQGDPNIDPPVGTLDQIQTREAQGDSYYAGPADPLKDWWVYGLMKMAEQLTVNMVAQVEAIGMLLDAKNQLETQQLLQQKMAEAHRDYQPSEGMCTFGTFVRDLAGTEQTMTVTKIAVANSLMQRELGSGDTLASNGPSDMMSRIAQFRKRFCNKSDNGKGLDYVCDSSGPAEMQDADINFTQTLDKPLSLKIDMDDGDTTTDEETVFALVDNLFVHRVTPRLAPKMMETDKFQYQYMNLRSIIAMRGMARNSIATIIALKTQTPNTSEKSNAPFLKGLMKEFGLTEGEIKKYLGENPSYYAQMELLTKKIYQDPTFYTALYDKPANVERMRAAMTAIKLMQDRDIQSALHRREMLMSMMLELRLREQAEGVYDATEAALFED